MIQLLDQLRDAVARFRKAGLTSADTSTAALESILNGFPFAALVADDHGAYVAANHDAAALTGYSVEELRRLSVWQLTPGVDESEAIQLWRAFIAIGEQRGAYSVLTKTGDTIAALYAARANVLPGLHLALLRPVP